MRDLAAEYKAGIPTTDLLEKGGEALTAPELEVTGVMVHLGRHTTELGAWRGMVASTVDLIARLSRHWGGWEPKEIDLGGGLAAPRDPTGGSSDPSGHPRATAGAPSIEEYAEALTSSLRESLERNHLDPKGKTLEVEPGRSLYADTGIHLARVRNLKTQSTPTSRRWVETDTTEMFLLDGIIEHNRWRTVLAEKADAPLTEPVDVVGISCGFDVIIGQATLPMADVGDTMVFLDTGAYQEACANNFNGLPRPGTALIRGNELEWIRRPETIDDVFGRDLIPSWLPHSERA